MKVTSEQLLNLFGFKEEKTLIKVKYVYENEYCDEMVSEHEIDEVEKLVLVIGTRLYDYEESLKDDLSLSYMGDIVDLIDKDFKIIKPTPKLTEDEKVILRNLPKEYKWIARDCDATLTVFEQKPYRKQILKFWLFGEEDSNCILGGFSHLFQFITWEDEEPYNIKELLNEKN
jgi:CRISPR/Cas system Type II protein with McrA/HNH and RuvC-like nuclease domain